MLGGFFEGNVDLYQWSHSANHSPEAVDKLLFYGVCKPTFRGLAVNIQARVHNIRTDTRYINFKSALYLYVLTKPVAAL